MKPLFKTMLFSSALSILLLYLRLQWSGSIHYAFLVWNLFLAWIPFLWATVLAQAKKEGRRAYQLLVLFGAWLLFFPNSPYIITDLFHLQQNKGVPLWFDLVLILSFAWNGLLLGLVSLLEVQQVLRAYLPAKAVQVFVSGLMILCSFGIYLGRYPRWNSWDLISNPIALSSDIGSLLLHPFRNIRMVGVTFFFSVFLILVYRTLCAVIRNFKAEQYEE